MTEKYTTFVDNFLCYYKIRNDFFLDFGLSRLASLQYIQYHVAGFYKPTIPQSPPSHLRDYSTCNNAKLEFFHYFCSKLWAKWMVLEKWSPSWGFEPRTSRSWVLLTTRPQLLAPDKMINSFNKVKKCFLFLLLRKKLQLDNWNVKIKLITNACRPME